MIYSGRLSKMIPEGSYVYRKSNFHKPGIRLRPESYEPFNHYNIFYKHANPPDLNKIIHENESFGKELYVNQERSRRDHMSIENFAGINLIFDSGRSRMLQFFMTFFYKHENPPDLNEIIP